MEESKLVALHDSLSKLRKSAGLGVSSQYSWQTGKTTKGSSKKDNGLPSNLLYDNFVKAGTYDPNRQQVDDGDGRLIKRDFSDCNGDDNESHVVSSDSEGRKKSKEKRKAEKKAARKAAKLEAKKKERLEQKKAEKKARKKELALQKAQDEKTLTEKSAKKEKKDKKKKGNKCDRKVGEKGEKRSEGRKKTIGGIG